jgi:hypothetical protein
MLFFVFCDLIRILAFFIVRIITVNYSLIGVLGLSILISWSLTVIRLHWVTWATKLILLMILSIFWFISFSFITFLVWRFNSFFGWFIHFLLLLYIQLSLFFDELPILLALFTLLWTLALWLRILFSITWLIIVFSFLWLL